MATKPTDLRVDLRSDTVTRPSPAMRQAMADAEVGDDVLGDDPTVIRLQNLAAEMLGHEAALYLPSGTQSNLAAILSHCQRGDEYLVGATAHTYKYEAGGAAVLGSVQPQPVPFQPDGTLDLGDVASAIKPDDPHFAQARLLCLENTVDGRVLPLSYHHEAQEFAAQRGLALHLDGARLANAAVALGVPLADIASTVDSVSVCLSKGLGAPVGSVLAGSAEVVTRAHRWRKMLGGSMRQAGVVAAAGIMALTENVERLADDHANAQLLADGLGAIPGFELLSVHTNMVFIGHPEWVRLADHFEANGVQVLAGNPMRLVTHLDVTADDVAGVVEIARRFGD